MKICIYQNGIKTFQDYSIMYKNIKKFFGTDAKPCFSTKLTNDRMRYQSRAFGFL